MTTRSGGLPQPPWTQAPAEVGAWLASTGGRPPARARPRPRQPRVRGFLSRLSAPEERRLRHRLEGLGFESVHGEGEALVGAVERLARVPPAESFRGTVVGIRVLVHLREGADRPARVSFAPRVTVRTARKIVLRLGLDPLAGAWL